MNAISGFAFEVIIVEHCNMRCKYCMHFSPLANTVFLDLKEYQKDMTRVSELCRGDCKEIVLVGGEPLLHPDIAIFISEARRLFRTAVIKIITNGILLPKMDENFWNVCKQCNVVIKVSRYPINFPYDQIKEFNHGVHIEFKNKYEMNYLPLDLDGKNDSVRNFASCISADKDHCLKHGRMYTCCVAANVEHFNTFFEKTLLSDENDSINIYEADSIESIISFLQQPIPFCRYCNVKCRIEDLPWEVSKCEISEWT